MMVYVQTYYNIGLPILSVLLISQYFQSNKTFNQLLSYSKNFQMYVRNMHNWTIMGWHGKKEDVISITKQEVMCSILGGQPPNNYVLTSFFNAQML